MKTNIDKIKNLLLKIDQLAKKGTGGEAINAQERLDYLLKKHGISYDSLFDAEVKDYYFSTSGYNTRILLQIAKSIDRDIKMYKFPAKWVKKHCLDGNTLIECTPLQYIEIENMYSVFKELWKSELPVFFTSFLTANDLLVDPESSDEREELTAEELSELLRIQRMSSSIKKGVVRKQITD